MKCKNCGAGVEKDSSICTNCGAVVNKDSDYVLLTNQDNAFQDVYSNRDNNRKRKPKPITRAMLVLISIAVIIGSGVASYFVFYGIESMRDKPELSFTSGTGVINDDEQVLYVGIDDSSVVEFIQGVNLYDGEVNEKNVKKAQLISSDYEYSQNVEKTFRCIFFDMDKLNLDEKADYTYTFEMKYSFVGDDNWYTYYQTVNFKGSTNTDASDIIFDHSLDQKLEETTTPYESEENGDVSDVAYLYDSYWYTKAYTADDTRSISAFKFASDGKFTSTDYVKVGDESWEVSTNSGEFSIDGNTLKIKTADGEEDEFTLDKKNKTISQGNNKLTSRKYNSTKNAEDFFGI